MTPKQPTVFADHYDDLTAKGYNVTPTKGKRPILDGWQNLTPLPEWKTTYAACNVGIVTGHNIIAIDIDVLDEPLATLIEQSAITNLGVAPCRYGKKPKRLLVYRINEEIHKHKITFTDSVSNSHAVEILAKGQQFITAGIHPDTQQPYEWETELPPVAQLTVVTLETIRAWLESLKTLLAEHNNCTGFKITGLNKVEVQATKPNTPIDLHNAEQAKAVIERLQNKLLEAANGDRHATRLRIGKVFGGYVAGGLVHENDALEALQVASDLIADDGETSITEWQSVRDAFEHGKESPIHSYNEPEESPHCSVLDNDKQTCNVDLMQFLDDEFYFKPLVKSMSVAMHLPVNSVLLAGIAIFSAITARGFVVERQNGATIPIGIYALIEQPSGTGKSWCMKSYEQPFLDVFKEHAEAYNRELKTLEAAEKNGKLSDQDASRLAELKANPLPILYITNATPEGVETTLAHSGGYFAIDSSEQGATNTVFGKTYGDGKKANNNDTILNGYDGGTVHIVRAGRSAYSGEVIGQVFVFAQSGMIVMVIEHSDGTGVAERFLYLAEPHQLGNRDHLTRHEIAEAPRKEYTKVSKHICNAVLNKVPVSRLTISDNGHYLIRQYKQQMEPLIADGAKYSHNVNRGLVGKADMQIMKIAANLHLLAQAENLTDPMNGTLPTLEQMNDSTFGTINTNIDDKWVVAAIGMVNELIEGVYQICNDKGILGKRAEYEAVLDYLNKSGARVERDIINSLRRTQPFKSMTGGTSKAIKDAINEMVAKKILLKWEKGKTFLISVR